MAGFRDVERRLTALDRGHIDQSYDAIRYTAEADRGVRPRCRPVSERAGEQRHGESAVATMAPSAEDSAANSIAAFREATTDHLVWTSAELQSLIFPGGDGDDVHRLTLRAAQVARIGRLEFGLPGPAKLVSVRMNGVRAESQREGSRFRLPTITHGGLQTLEIQYLIPSDRDFLRNRQTIPVPRVDAPVLGFRWLFAFPPEAPPDGRAERSATLATARTDAVVAAILWSAGTRRLGIVQSTVQNGLVRTVATFQIRDGRREHS